LAADLPAVIDRALEAGLRDIALPAIDFDSLQGIAALHHPTLRFHAMAGIHPCDVPAEPLDVPRLEAWAALPQIVGIGETGLDYYWSKDLIEQQKTSLRHHCRIARESGKPLILHNRESTTDLWDLISEEQDGRLFGVWHCFTGTLDEGKRALDLGFMLGLGGVLTYKNGLIDTYIHEFPKDRIVLETDAPFLSPVPHRGQRNEPAFMLSVAEKLSVLWNTSLDETARITTANARRLFRLAP
jgi:TatD DNase family protein